MSAFLKKADWFFIVAVILAIWSLATGILWIYWAALYVSYPASILAMYIWTRLRHENKNYYIIIPVIVIVGWLFSIGILVNTLF